MIGIGFGTWAWGNKLLWGYDSSRDDLVLKETFNQAIKGGLSFVDTADSYGTGKLRGRSELLLGRFINNLTSNQQKKLIVGTKIAPFPWRINKEKFEKAFLSSKKRLQGHVQRVQLHWSTSRYAPWQEVEFLDGMMDLIEKKEINELGVSNIGPKRLRWMHNRCAKRGIKISSLQVQFSLLSPILLTNPAIKQVCNELEIEILAYSPLALGLLVQPPGEEAKYSNFLRKSIIGSLIPGSNQIRQHIFKLANTKKISPAEVSLNWIRAHGAMPIPGLRSPSQAEEASKALIWEMSEEEKKILDEISISSKVRMPQNPFLSD